MEISAQAVIVMPTGDGVTKRAIVEFKDTTGALVGTAIVTMPIEDATLVFPSVSMAENI